jgi:hypothetical protein
MFAHLGLGSEWERPTVELSALRPRNPSPNLKKLFHRSLVSGQALGAAVVAGLTVGIAVLAFGSANKPSHQLTASGTMQPVDQAVVEAAARAQGGAVPGGTILTDSTPAQTIVGNPALALAPNAIENLKLRPVKETKKAKKTHGTSATGDPAPVRLPPSGL